MKKYLIALVTLLLAFSVLVFAGSSVTTYTVSSFTGKVTYEAAPGKWEPVKVGQQLSGSTVVNTGVNATLVLQLGEDLITIKPMQKATLDSLVEVATASKGLKKGVIAQNNTAAETNGDSKGVATASSRASDAAEDLEMDE